MEIRTATVEDAEGIQRIYAPYVEKTAVTFEYVVPGIESMRQRIADTLQEYPYLVAAEGDRILGYAYAGSFHTRAAYRHSAEVSIYLDEACRGQGMGAFAGFYDEHIY